MFSVQGTGITLMQNQVVTNNENTNTLTVTDYGHTVSSGGMVIDSGNMIVTGESVNGRAGVCLHVTFSPATPERCAFENFCRRRFAVRLCRSVLCDQRDGRWR